MNVLHKMALLALALLISGMAGAQEAPEYVVFARKGYQFPYRIDAPDQKWKLPDRLVEVSGLAYVDQERLACIQDEKGNIYLFNTKSGEVESKVDFGGDGDYEGVEVLNDDAWVIKSNGDIYRVKDFLKDEKPDTKKFETFLSKRNEPEGLGYDPLSGMMLIPCKGHPFLDGSDGSSHKAIYMFDPGTRDLVDQPAFIISLDTLKLIRDYNTLTRWGLSILSGIDESKGDVTFQPSGVAVHPITHELYLIGAVGNVLLVISRDGGLLAMIELRSSKFPQPEGICFAPDGTLYIANEGKDNKATIQQFRMKGE